MHTPVSEFASVAVTLLLGSCTAAYASSLYSYDASLGTLPEAQGFDRVESGSPPVPTVGGGILHQFPGAVPSVQAWQNNSIPLDFTTTPYFLEVDLHVISSNFVPPNRVGYYLEVSDSARRDFAVGISNDLIRLTTHANFEAGTKTVSAAFNPRDGFHTYWLVIDAGMGTLYVDGTALLALPIDPSVRPEPEVANRVIFGDLSGLGVSETELRSFQFGVVPEPGTLLLAALGLAGILLHRRRLTAP